MRINNNVMAINSHRQLGMNNIASQKSMEKLSSGYRVNRAGDDAAGLSISEKMRSQIRGLNQASRNAQDGISLIQTAEGALNEAHAILQRIRELAVQSSNDTNEDIDREALNNEVQQLVEELDRIAEKTEFNEKVLLNGKFSGTDNALTFQVGANAGDTVKMEIGKMDTATLTGDKKDEVKVDSRANASGAITHIDTAIKNLSAQRSILGAMQNRLEHTVKNLDNSAENLQAAESRIRDVDMAQEIMTFTKQNILSQAATAMLAQANMAPQSVLQLLG